MEDRPHPHGADAASGNLTRRNPSAGVVQSPAMQWWAAAYISRTATSFAKADGSVSEPWVALLRFHRPQLSNLTRHSRLPSSRFFNRPYSGP
jgi:hypothetical protein